MNASHTIYQFTIHDVTFYRPAVNIPTHEGVAVEIT